MRKLLLCLVTIASLGATPLFAQNRLQTAAPTGMTSAAAGAASISLSGKWTYRSYNNTTGLVGDDAAKALALIFGEGVFSFETPSSTTLKGTLDMGGGFVLDLQGAIRHATQGSP